MPELPEVEVSRMGITPHVLNQVVTKVNIHNASMRWPVPDEVYQLEGLVVSSIERRAKYLLLECELGAAILHLGMSGNLRVVNKAEPLKKHDHVEFILANNKALRLNDPRRFGCCLWQAPNEKHKLLAKLGPEPLLITSDLQSIPKALELSKRTVLGIRQNLFWAFIYNLIGIPIAAGVLYPVNGFLLDPMIAGMAMAFSSVSVVLNSLRLKRVKL